MATISSFKLNGQDNLPPIEWQNLSVKATFDNDSVQANINFSALTFIDEANEIIKDWFFNNVGATEGIPLDIDIADGANTYTPFSGYLDWATYSVKASNRCEMSLVKTDSLNGVSERSKGITMRLLEENGLMPKTMGVNIPYVVENRKTNLEHMQIIATVVITVKTGIDEIFKLINLVSDIASIGIAIALINLAVTIAMLLIMINQLVAQLVQLQQSLFPLARLHRGIKLKTFLEQGAIHMGYTMDFGTFGTLLDKVVLCPHKTDEEGIGVSIFGGTITANISNNISGILKPTDFGYTLSEAFQLANKLFNTKVAVQGNTIICKPYNDSSWVLNPTYTMPNVLVENDEFTSNGSQSYNIDEMVGRTLVSYQFDDSDKWTISNVNDSISETIVTPITVNNTKNVILKGINDIQIPYALCVRKGTFDALWDSFMDLVNINEQWMNDIKDTFTEWASNFEDEAYPSTNSFLAGVFMRNGAMKVENDFFSTPKIVYLDNGSIPTNFTNYIGANALYNNYHSYNSFVAGIKDPSNYNNTNQKKIYTDVTIPFGAESFSQIINNSFFYDFNGNLGKFTSVDWQVDKDKAVVSYYIFENYVDNLFEVTI